MGGGRRGKGYGFKSLDLLWMAFFGDGKMGRWIGGGEMRGEGRGKKI